MNQTHDIIVPLEDVLAPLAQADMLLWLAGWLRPPRPALEPQPTAEQLKSLLDTAALSAQPQLHDRLLHLLAAAAVTTPAELRFEYHRLFDAGINCPVNESAYIRRDKGAILGDISGFYYAFGFACSPDAAEKPDHLACELEFIARLLILLSQARHADLPEAFELTRQALADFAGDHLSEWLLPFCSRLEATTHLPAHAALASSLAVTWQAIVRYYGFPPCSDAHNASDIPAEPESPYECDMSTVTEPAGRGPVNLSLRGHPLPAPQ